MGQSGAGALDHEAAPESLNRAKAGAARQAALITIPCAFSCPNTHACAFTGSSHAPVADESAAAIPTAHRQTATTAARHITADMPHNLMIVALAFAIGQSPVAQLAPMLDRDAYAIYATLLPRLSRQGDAVVLLVQETTTNIQCIPPLPKSWDGVRKDFDRQNATSWMLRAVVPTDVRYRLIPKTEIEADDARLEREYPGVWQRRPGSLDFVAFSAVGFNAGKTKALVYVQTRSSFQTTMMERQGDNWVAPKEGVACGGGA